MTTGNRIKLAREAAKLSLSALADLLQISRSTLTRYETGVFKSIPADVLGKVSALTGCSLEFLFGLTDEPFKTRSGEAGEEERYQRLLGKIIQKAAMLNCTGLVILSQQAEEVFSDKRFRRGKR